MLVLLVLFASSYPAQSSSWYCCRSESPLPTCNPIHCLMPHRLVFSRRTNDRRATFWGVVWESPAHKIKWIENVRVLKSIAAITGRNRLEPFNSARSLHPCIINPPYLFVSIFIPFNGVSFFPPRKLLSFSAQVTSRNQSFRPRDPHVIGTK